MKVFAIGDLHLSFSGSKPMDIFGPHWENHAAKIAAAWRVKVRDEDVVCLPGDFSWSMKLDEVAAELEWLATLPGKKVLLKGNHDYWWSSAGKVRKALPPGIEIIHNDSLSIDGVTFAGARGWVDHKLDFSDLDGHPERDQCGKYSEPANVEDDRRLYERELGRLEMSLSSMDKAAGTKIALTHFPPTSPAMEETEVTRILEAHGVDIVVFGHLHRSAPTTFKNPFGEKKGIRYYLASADFISFEPIQLLQLP